ncbi:Crp/Fnr family transcriptional regulator [Caminibacter mediatlanticus TB-2]|uniref:Crp/Fnr family transcriptional regulator n=1 Tax=Caminibacter mediatlanticus TB-2 TaxID=391592 RepID=A0ABX5VCE0_9BACT|nr:Crp/Fnr family transcriptional regulator [Caminibacter mediatlanticus]QCT95212.1 Crp/Fnr family transcriptional regulator [Caminibacter mediatlanticus TB-2]
MRKSCRLKITSFPIEKIVNKEDLQKFPKINFKKGEIYYPEDIKLLLIEKGEAKVIFVHSDKEFILYYLKEGNFYVMHPQTYLEFKKDSTIYLLDPNQFNELYQNKDFANAILNSFTKIMMLEKEIIKELAFYECEQRIANFLLNITKNCIKDQNDNYILKKKLTVTEISNFIGVRRQTASKIFNQFIEEGIIEKKRGDLIIKNIKKLKEIVKS